MANGSVWPDDPNATVHHMKMLPGHRRVSFESVLKTGYLQLKLPVPSKELKLIGQAVGVPVMWPGEWIEAAGEVFFHYVLTFHFDTIRV